MYSAKTFNIFLFPAPFEQYDRRFLSQASSLAFLAEQGFDFNTCIRDGVPYMPLQLRDALLRRVRLEKPLLLFLIVGRMVLFCPLFDFLAKRVLLLFGTPVYAAQADAPFIMRFFWF